MYDITQLTFFTNIVAFALTYLLHSTAWILLTLCLLKSSIFSTPLLRNLLWKGALIGGLLSSLLLHFSGNSLLEIQLAKESRSEVAFNQQPAIDEHLVPIAKEAFVPTSIMDNVVKENLVVDILPADNKLEKNIEKEAIMPLATAKKETTVSFKIFSFLLLLSCFFWGIGIFFFILKETIRHFVFIKKIGERTSINHPTFDLLLQQIRLKLGQKLTVHLSHSLILESPILIKNQEICLPEKALSQLNAPQIEAMLAHEMAHIVRKDYYWNCFLLVLDTLLFFQPLHSLAIKEIQTTNELLCDEWAAKIIGNNLALAQCLLAVATWMKTPAKKYPLVAGMSLKKSELSNRITSLLNLPDMKKQRFKFLKVGLPFVVFFSLAIFVLPSFTFTSIKDTPTVSTTDNEDDNAAIINYHQHTHVHVLDEKKTAKTIIEEKEFNPIKKKPLENIVNEKNAEGKESSQDLPPLEMVEKYSKRDVSTVERLGNEFRVKYLDVGIPFYAKKYSSMDPNKLPIPLDEKKSTKTKKTVVKEGTIPTIRLEEKFEVNKNHIFFEIFHSIKERDGAGGKEYIKSIYFTNLSCAGDTRQQAGGPLVKNKRDKNSLIFTLDYGDYIEYDTLQNCVHPPNYEGTNTINSTVLESLRRIKDLLLPNYYENSLIVHYGNFDNDIQGDHPKVVETQWVQQRDSQKETPIGIKLKGRAAVKIEIRTTKGRSISTIADGIFEEGIHEFTFPHVNIKKGTYRLITTVDGEALSQNIRVRTTRSTNKK